MDHATIAYGLAWVGTGAWGVVKLTFRLAQLLAGMPYSPYEDATINQPV